MRSGDAHLARFEAAQALLAYEEELRADRRDAKASAGRVRALWLLRRYREARYHLQDILARFPRWPDTHVAAGYVALGQRDDPLFLGVLEGSSHRDTEEARHAFDSALSLAADCVPAWRGLSATARLDGDLNGALSVLAKAEAEVGSDPQFSCEYAMCARDDGLLSDALIHIGRATRLTPLHVESLLAAARIHLDLGDPVGAVQALEALAPQYLDCAPYHATAAAAYDSLAMTMPDRQSRIEPRKLRDIYIRAACRDPAAGPPEIGIAVRVVYPVADQAIMEFRKALEGAPYSPLLRVGISGHLLQGKENEAASQARLACTSDRMNVPAQVAEARAFLASGNVPRAAAVAQHLIDLHPRQRLALCLMAKIDGHYGRFESALNYATTAWEGSPSRQDSLTSLADAQMALGDIASAEDSLRAGIEHWPGDPQLRVLDVLCVLSEGRRPEALSRLKKARSLADPSADADSLVWRVRRWFINHPLSRLMGGLIDREAIKRLQATTKSRQRQMEYVPDGDRPRVTGLLRSLDWDASRSYTLAVCFGSLIVGILFAAIIIVPFKYFPHWIFQLGELKNATWDWTKWDALIIVPSAGLLFTRSIRTRAVLACAAAVGTAVYIAFARHLGQWRYSEPAILISDIVIDLTIISFIFGSVALLARAFTLMVRAWEGRSRHRNPGAAMISSLLDLLELLTRGQFHSVNTRARCMQLIEQTARSQEHALIKAIAGGGGRADPATAEQALRWATRTAAATRQLKEQILAPDAGVIDSLAAEVNKLLGIACRQHWGQLEQANPPPRRQRAVGVLLLATRTFVIAVIPIAALVIYEVWIRPLDPTSLPKPTSWETIVVAAIWPITTILWRLDPDMSDKISFVSKFMGGTASSDASPRVRGKKI